MKIVLSTIVFCFFFLAAYSQPEPCGQNPAMTSTCADACVICDIDGFTGRNDLTAQGQTFQGFCTTMFHNMNYISFIAGSTDLSVKVTVSNCNIGWGLEIGFFESTDCETFTPITECNTNISANSSYTFTNDVPLVIGQYYYLIMDGSGGDRCDWTFDVISGSTAVGVLTTSGDISGEMETCADFPTTYTTSGNAGATIFQWTVNGLLQPINSPTIDLTFPADGIYELCVTASNVCDEAPPSCTNVLVRTPETLEIDEAICEGDSLIVAGETLTNTGDYEFHITTFNGCDSAIFVSLEVLPQASDFVDVNICNGNSFFVGQIPYTQTGIYTDTLLTMEQCDSVVTLDLFVIECEIIGSTNFTAPICHGEATGTLVFSVENGTPPFTYDWSHITNPGIGGTGSTNLFVDNEIFNVPKGIYEINIMDTFGNDVVLFQEVTEPPPLSIEMTANDLNGFNLSCYDGSDGTASAIPSGGVPSYSYSWDNGSSLSTAGNLTAGPAIVFITDAAGCEQSDSINLIAPPPIEANVLFIDSNCDGIETGMVILDSISGGTPPYTYSLGNMPFSNTDTYTDLGPGTYTFTTMDANDCQALIAGTTSTPSIPIIDLGDDLVVQLGCDIAIPAVGANINQVLWTDGAHLDCDTCLHPFASPIENSTYQVIVSSIDDCTATASISISVDKVRDVYFPNAFSPNGDGINDVFFIGAGKAVVQISSLQVYSRWGERVYEGFDLAPNDPLAGWDGIFKNEKMNPGLFLWTAEIEFLDGFSEQYGGDILLMK